MIQKLLIRGFCFAICFLAISVRFSEASYGEFAPAKTASVGIPNLTGECIDYSGRSIQHTMHFIPPGVDMCKLCICENGFAKACRSVLCTPPPECKSFQMGSSCCEFICIDDTLYESSGLKSKTVVRVVSWILAVVSSVIIFSCCICFCNRMRNKRDQRTAVNAAPKVAFSEDLYLKMSVEMIEKNEEIIDLRKRISVLETQLTNGQGSKRNPEQILRAENDDWKNAYDLHVNLRD